MLSKEENILLDFIEECKGHMIFRDKSQQELEKTIEFLEKITLSLKDDDKKLSQNLTGLTGLIYDLIDATKETYFQYGLYYSWVKNSSICYGNK